MNHAPDPLLQEIVVAAVTVSSAARAWLLAKRPDSLEVVAAGGAGADTLLGRTVGVDEGVAGYVVNAAQPLALLPRPDDTRLLSGLDALVDPRPASILCVPCAVADATLGVLQVVDKNGGGQFSFDDLEIVTVLAAIAGVAMAQAAGPVAPPDPAQLTKVLASIAVANPARYTAIAALITSSVAHD